MGCILEPRLTIDCIINFYIIYNKTKSDYSEYNNSANLRSDYNYHRCK